MHSRLRFYSRKAVLISLAVLIPFALLELGYRIIVPYFYYHGDYTSNQVVLNRYDPVLGWSGMPGVKGWDYMQDIPVYVETNNLGFRDFEHDMSSLNRAIVFLGGSYVLGFDMQKDKMFVNLLRSKLPNYDIFNLSNLCYGIDQDLLTLENWQKSYSGQIKLVILAFTTEDVERVSKTIDCDKGKPKFEIANDKLVLTGVPVPKTDEWEGKKEASALETTEQKKNVKTSKPTTWKGRVRKLMFNSYFLGAMYNRYAEFRNTGKFVQERQDRILTRYQPNKDELILISKILKKIDKIARARGGKLIVFFVPSYLEISNDSNYHPYQREIIKSCQKLGIGCFDLAPTLKKAWWKTYIDNGLHWNEYGHKLAAKAMYREIKNQEH